MALSFDAIPINILVPGVYVEINNERAFRGLFGIPTKILVMGQKLPGGSAVAMRPDRITSADQADAYYGRGSLLSHMLAAFIRANSWLEVWAIPLDDNAAGVVANGTITLTGPATAPGTLNLYVGGRRVQVGIAAAQTATSLATAIAAAINADQTLPVTASAEAAVVTVTARHKGECGNYIDLRHSYYTGEGIPAGVTITFGAMAGGAGNPLVQPVLDFVGDEWYTDIVTPYIDAPNLTAVEAKLAANFGPLKMRDGHAWTGASGSQATLGTLGDSRNSPHLSIIGAKGSPTPPWEWGACLAGIGTYYTSIDPARPLQQLVMPGLLAPKIGDRFTLQEENLLLHDGIASFGVDASGQVILHRAVTTYKTNAFGASDPSYLDVETLKTLALLRFDLRNLIAVRFPRSKLADDGTRFSRGQNVVTPKTIKAEIIARFGAWEAQGLVENVDQFKADIIVERDPNDANRVNALIPPNLVNGLRVFAGQIQFLL